MQMLPYRAQKALSELLDKCAEIKAGQRVLILAYVDGLYGGDNLVDEKVIQWIENGVRERGANPYVLWVNEEPEYLKWNFPPIVKAAMSVCDLMINNTFDLSHEENVEFKQFVWKEKKLVIRNFAVTAELMNTKWASTPYELLEKIRYKLCEHVREGLTFEIRHSNGTNVTGKIAPAYHPAHPWFTSYTVKRKEVGYYRPWPEWVTPIIRAVDVEGTFVFSEMLSWWSRIMGLSPYLREPIIVRVKSSKIVDIDGGEEAKALSQFLKRMEEKLGKGVYDFNAFHFGVHPFAEVSDHVCQHILYRRLIEHSNLKNIHFHIGAPDPTKTFPYWMHCTADLRDATVRIGEKLIYENGRAFVLEDEEIQLLLSNMLESI